MRAKSARKAIQERNNPVPMRYRVMRTMTLSPTDVLQPGEIVTPGDDWPYRRASQLVSQGYLAPFAGEATVSDARPKPASDASASAVVETTEAAADQDAEHDAEVVDDVAA